MDVWKSIETQLTFERLEKTGREVEYFKRPFTRMKLRTNIVLIAVCSF